MPVFIAIVLPWMDVARDWARDAGKLWDNDGGIEGGMAGIGCSAVSIMDNKLTGELLERILSNLEPGILVSVNRLVLHNLRLVTSRYQSVDRYFHN